MPSSPLPSPDHRSAPPPRGGRPALAAVGALAAFAAFAAFTACARHRVGEGAAAGAVGGAADTTVPAGALPMRLAPRPTGPAITARDLMTRLYAFADDSMEGREAGTEGNLRGTALIERELRRLGLEPAGENGTFFQAVPLVRRGFDRRSSLAVGGQGLMLGTDFVLLPMRGTPRRIDEARVVYGGVFGGEMLPREQIAGRFVIFSSPPDARNGYVIPPRIAPDGPLAAAAAVAIVGPERLPPALNAFATTPSIGLGGGVPSSSGDVPVQLVLTRAAAERLLGAAPAGIGGLARGAAGTTVRGDVRYAEEPAPARNVVAILRGSDPALRGQFVALGAHSDHVGYSTAPVDHDSLKAFNAEARRIRLALDPEGDEIFTPQQEAEIRRRVAAIRVNVDSLRRIRPARLDSINNGADDDGSGSMALLEIAENLVAMPARPKRSILFVWHTAEEKGLVGARWYADRPTVPRDSIVAQLNIDMIGRGATAADQRKGAAGYVGVIGARRLSTGLGDLLDAVNGAQPAPLRLDGALDSDGHPQNIYCRSDHYHYARYGIPIAFFFTGLHGDYHQVTDEPQYIDYPNYARITGFVRDVALRVANAAGRPIVDRPKPDPNGSCRQ